MVGLLILEKALPLFNGHPNQLINGKHPRFLEIQSLSLMILSIFGGLRSSIFTTSLKSMKALFVLFKHRSFFPQVNHASLSVL